MDWPLVRRCTLRYSLLYGGVTVAAAVAAAAVLPPGGGIALVLVVGAGFVILLFVFGGSGDVRMGTAMTNAQALGLRTGIVDAADDQREPIGSDLMLLFYALGLIGLGVAAMVVL